MLSARQYQLYLDTVLCEGDMMCYHFITIDPAAYAIMVHQGLDQIGEQLRHMTDGLIAITFANRIGFILDTHI